MPKASRHNGEHDGEESKGWDRNATAEALVDPEPIEDSLEDVLREAIHPEKLSDIALEKLVQLIGKRQVEDHDSPEAYARIKAIIHGLSPKPFELADRWAFLKAISDPSVDDISQQMISKMLGLHEWTVAYRVCRWRKILKYKPIGKRSQANHIGHRTRREKAARL
jgi:hypothetical protein